jgi:hypothetical protein
MRGLIVVAAVVLAGCVTESQHIHSVTLPSGKPGYVIVCNSYRYDRCLSRAARVCNGAYTILPDARSTVRMGDAMEGVGNGEAITVSCGS